MLYSSLALLSLQLHACSALSTATPFKQQPGLSAEALRNAPNPPATSEHDIDYCAMRIRNREERFVSDHAWINWLRANHFTEHYMTQDVQRWRNQNVVCSVFNAKHHGGGYLVEAINVDRNL